MMGMSRNLFVDHICMCVDQMYIIIYPLLKFPVFLPYPLHDTLILSETVQHICPYKNIIYGFESQVQIK